jgi:AhpC/TSA family
MFISRLTIGLVLVGMMLSAVPLQAETPPSPISAALNDYQTARDAFRRRERKERPSPLDTARVLRDLIAKTPADAGVVDAAGWILVNAPEKDVLAVLLPALCQHHTKSPELTALCLLAAREAGEAWEETMIAIERDNSSQETKASAAYALGCIYRDAFDEKKKALTVATFQAVMKNYATVEIGNFSPAKMAERALFSVNSLQVGQVAPEIEGKDADGTSFKLSDYRGKVVVLSFYGFW